MNEDLARCSGEERGEDGRTNSHGDVVDLLLGDRIDRVRIQNLNRLGGGGGCLHGALDEAELDSSAVFTHGNSFRRGLIIGCVFSARQKL